MIQSPNNSLDIQAWTKAWRFRCCPPDRILSREKGSKALKQHLRLCPWCKKDVDAGFHQSMPPPVDYRHAIRTPPKTGELWAVKENLEGWGEKGRYYNAPVVLVVEIPGSRVVSVLQIHDDIHFSGPGDLQLFPEFEGFAESWNRYSLCVDDLAFPLGSISPDKLNSLNGASPENMTAISQGSLLWFFRHMEVETGYFFARQSIAKLLSELEGAEVEIPKPAPAIPLWHYKNREELAQDLRSFSLQLPSQFPAGTSLLDTLALVTLPEERLPLAAADTTPSVNALVFTCSEGKIIEWATHQIEITLRERDAEQLLLAGKVVGLPFEYEEFLCWWKTNKRLHAPLPGTFGFIDGTFWATFFIGEDRDALQDGQLIIRVLRKG